MPLNSYPNLTRLHYKKSITILFCVHVSVCETDRGTEPVVTFFINHLLPGIIYISTDVGSHQNHQQEESKWDSYVLFFLIFIFTLFYFTILYWFCHTLTWIYHGCTCIPKHEHPSHLPPHNISLGHHRAPAPSMLYPASDIDWWFDSYMIVSWPFF